MIYLLGHGEKDVQHVHRESHNVIEVTDEALFITLPRIGTLLQNLDIDFVLVGTACRLRQTWIAVRQELGPRTDKYWPGFGIDDSTMYNPKGEKVMQTTWGEPIPSMDYLPLEAFIEFDGWSVLRQVSQISPRNQLIITAAQFIRTLEKVTQDTTAAVWQANPNSHPRSLIKIIEKGEFVK